MGGRLGGSQLSDACNISGAECTDSGFSAGFFAGYDWNDYIALEFAYDWLGSYKTSFIEGNTGYRQDANMSALTLAPKFAYPFTEDWSVFGKIGAAYTTYGDRNATALMGALVLNTILQRHGPVVLNTNVSTMLKTIGLILTLIHSGWVYLTHLVMQLQLLPRRPLLQ
ncbi:outer membrane protein A precursor [Vibrio variabilis]|uniref:Outer membrane protein A n=1 Tax=Vibrio variabilis TaxID=990271 RepID=A0ABQ0JIN5_9VIBR|nr:outer membrane protein A precursor [Vibrio variabilis]